MKTLLAVIVTYVTLASACFPAVASAPPESCGRQRLIILADMGNEPDEEQQMAHMLVNCNEFDLEGLIAVTGKFLRETAKSEYKRRLHPELFHRLIDGYSQVLPNLRLHAGGWPEADSLHSIVYEGQQRYGIADVGDGKSSPGSQAIVREMLKDDPRPLWVVVNAGANTLAQALIDLRTQLKDDSAKFDSLVLKLRVFENGAQDNAGAWICHEFPTIHWIRSNYQTYAFGGPGGRDGNVRQGLGPHFWKPYEYSAEGQHDWLKEHVRTGHGALGDLYPERRFGVGLAFMEGGGTVPWLGLVNKGLSDVDQPSWGGWSGRFSAEKVANVWSRHADIKRDEQRSAPFAVYREVSDVWTDPESGQTFHGDYVPVWRWRPATYANLICRMDWCVKPFAEANHHPVAAFNGDKSDAIVRLTALAGQQLEFDASASTDPDDDTLVFSWWQYQEAGTYPGRVFIEDADAAKARVHIPTGAGDTQVHIILEVRDTSQIASLHDYRRVVIDVREQIVELESVQK
ncbi:MAG: nucleoside hydrolase-like domain-containing protein [Planctomycetota bacterium]